MPADFSNLDEQTRAMLEDRYGINAHRNSAARTSWRWVALLLAVIGLPWLFWSAWHHSNPEFRTSLVSFRTIDDRSMEITFDITRRDPSRPLTCTVNARDFDNNVVGEKDVAVVGGGPKLMRQRVEIPTRIRAVSAEILRCNS